MQAQCLRGGGRLMPQKHIRINSSNYTTTGKRSETTTGDIDLFFFETLSFIRSRPIQSSRVTTPDRRSVTSRALVAQITDILHGRACQRGKQLARRRTAINPPCPAVIGTCFNNAHDGKVDGLSTKIIIPVQFVPEQSDSGGPNNIIRRVYLYASKCKRVIQ